MYPLLLNFSTHFDRNLMDIVFILQYQWLRTALLRLVCHIINRQIRHCFHIAVIAVDTNREHSKYLLPLVYTQEYKRICHRSILNNVWLWPSQSGFQYSSLDGPGLETKSFRGKHFCIFRIHEASFLLL